MSYFTFATGRGIFAVRVLSSRPRFDSLACHRVIPKTFIRCSVCF